MDASTAVIILGSIFIVLLIIGMPIAFTMLLASTISLFLAFGMDGLFSIGAVILNVATNELYLAIPLFTLMAMMLTYSGIVEQIFDTTYKFFGNAKGGLAYLSVAMAAVLAAATGLGGTGVVVIAPLAIPEMIKRKYAKDFMYGLIPAAATLGPIIPPSIVMIVLASYTGESVGAMFLGGIIPGLLIAVGYCLYVAIRCMINPAAAPGMESTVSWGARLKSLVGLIPITLLIVATLGSIYAGIATATEAAGVGATGALIFMIYHGQFNWKNVKDVLNKSLLVSLMVYWLLMGGNSLAVALTRTGISAVINDTIIGMALSPGVLVTVMVIIGLLLGMFIDAIAIIVITLPIFVPLLQTLHVDLLWFGVVYTVALCIGYITPPFGANLFYLKGILTGGKIVDHDVGIMDLYRAAIPYCLVMMLCLIIIMLIPAIITWAPRNLM